MSQIARLRKALSWGMTVALAVSIALVPSDQALAATKHKKEFRLSGTAVKASDPQNPANDVIKIRTDLAPFFGIVSRKLNVKIETLDNQLEFKSKFFPANGGNTTTVVALKSCSEGIPRITLLIDADGDGDFQQAPASVDFAAHGHIQPVSGCLPDTWKYDDLTDNLARWEVAAGGSVPDLVGFNTWDTFELAVMTAFVNHQVCVGFLVDADEGRANQKGTAFYDLISIGSATYHNDMDSGRRGFAQGCDEKGDGDRNGDHDGDGDRNGDHDDAADDDDDDD